MPFGNRLTSISVSGPDAKATLLASARAAAFAPSCASSHRSGTPLPQKLPGTRANDVMWYGSRPSGSSFSIARTACRPTSQTFT